KGGAGHADLAVEVAPVAELIPEGIAPITMTGRADLTAAQALTANLTLSAAQDGVDLTVTAEHDGAETGALTLDGDVTALAGLVPPQVLPIALTATAGLTGADAQASFIPQGSGPVAALSDLDVAQTMATYFGMIAELDHQIGRVLDHLEATGEIDETLIIFTSDHGELLGDHYMFGKAGPFEGSFRIPLILAEPGGTARTVDAFTESVDLMPTILDWLGAPVPRACDGASLLPWMRGETPATWRDGVMLEFDLRSIKTQTPLGLHPDDGGAAIWRDETTVYAHYAGLPPMSYDLRTDPHELQNLGTVPEQGAAVLDDLKELPKTV
ncbi:MAG: sulfatase-like hydrolase/transferase, partial [Okeania sp. SIO3C4]|nr:sulfatase-like hydrolase/transferase [Okeania sp. SIO3C4]